MDHKSADEAAERDPHDTEPAGADEVSVRAGHEPDRFQVKSVLYVPLIMTLFVLTAFGVVTATFFMITGNQTTDPVANPQAAGDSQKPLNARVAAISSTDPNARVVQPRLEYLKQTGNPGDPNDPPHYRSKLPVPAEGATWEIYPEDLRPERFVDPTKKSKLLVEDGWLTETKDLAHIRIRDAMQIVVSQKKLPTRKDAKPLEMTSVPRADQGDGGQLIYNRQAIPGVIIDRSVPKGDDPAVNRSLNR